jgi:hypothetical protein
MMNTHLPASLLRKLAPRPVTLGAGSLGLGAAVLATSLLTAAPASAVEKAEVHTGASVGGLIGIGENEYLFNTGVRFGWTLPAHVYLGGMFMLHVGTGPYYYGYYGNGPGVACYNAGPYSGACGGANTLGFTTGFEGGYEFAAGPVVVRPYGGIGFANITYNYGGAVIGTGCPATPGNPNGYCYSSNYTTSSIAVWGGGTAMYDFRGGPWFVMGDLRIGIAPAFWTNQVMAAFTVGGGYEF